MTVEFDITLEQLGKLAWEMGDLIQHSGATWKVVDVTKDTRMSVAWVTMRKLVA